MGKQAALQALTNVPGSFLIEINKMVGIRLLTKFGETGAVNLCEWVPFIGAGVSAKLSHMATVAVGQAAVQLIGPSKLVGVID